MKPSKPPSASPPDSDELTVFIQPDGSVAFVYDDNLHEMLTGGFPEMETRRASHCEPAPDGWAVDVSPLTGGPEQIIAVASRRSDALAAEVRWLHNHLQGTDNAEIAMAMPNLSELPTR
jgi:hypothetical protein